MKPLVSIGRKRLYAGAGIAAAALALPVLLSAQGRTWAGGDLKEFHIPHLEVARATSLREGSLPLWDFHQYGGTPLAGSGQDGLSFPPMRLLTILPVTFLLDLLIAGFFLVAAIGMYRLIRSWRARREAAVLGACAYTLSFALTGRLAAGHFGIIAAVSQAPLVLFLVRTIMLRPSPRKALLLGLASASILVTGHPAFVFHLAILAVALAIAELVKASRQSRPVGRPLLLLGIAPAAALLLSAVHLLPLAEVRSYATRGEQGASEVYSHQPPDFSFLPRDLSAFWVPLCPRPHFIQGDNLEYFWFEKAVYAGVLPLLGAGFVLLIRPWPAGTGFFGAVFVAALADGMSRHLPVHDLLGAVFPIYSAFRVPARVVWVSTLAVCLLAALGWNRWIAGASSRTDRLRALGAWTLAGAGVVLGLAVRYGLRGELALLGLLLPAAVGLAMLARHRPRIGSVAAIALTVVELLAQAASAVPTASRTSIPDPPWYLSYLGPDPSIERILDLSGGSYRSAPYGVRNLNGYGYPVLRGTARLYDSAWETPPGADFNGLRSGARIVDGRPLDLLNVGWVLCKGGPLEEGQIEVARQGGVVLYRRPSRLPYAFAGSHPVAAFREANAIRIRSNLSSPETLVVSESWMPGWRARLDETPVEVKRFEEALLSVELPAGEHEVLFTYEPTSYRTGRWISLLAAAAVLGALAFPLLRKITCALRGSRGESRPR